ncbi:MAG: metallophosphoesterase [Ignavibacteriaceae bacterium]
MGDTQHISFLESLYWGYWGESNQIKTMKILNEIARREPAFLVHLGDMIFDGSSEGDWKKFESDNEQIIKRNIPYYPIFGNHEYFGSNDKVYRNFYKRFPHIAGKLWYSFVREKIGFIMLNSNFEELEEREERGQKKWYLNKIKEMESDTLIKGIIVCSHYPPYTNSRIVNPSETIRREYAPPFYKSKKGVFFFSGHCHSYEKFFINGKYFIVSGGGGGPRQPLNTDPESREFDDKFRGEEIRFLHFCEVEIRESGMTLSVIRLEESWKFSVADIINYEF